MGQFLHLEIPLSSVPRAVRKSALGAPRESSPKGHRRLFGDVFGVGVREAEQEWVVGCFTTAEELSWCLALTSSPAAGGLGWTPGL